MSTINIGLVQINNSFSGQSYLPYSTALIQGYVKTHAKNPSSYHFLSPIYNRIDIDEAVEKLSDSNFVFFSTYVWNEKISLAIAKKIKEKYPTIKIIFGGPQVPDNNENFLRNNDFVDLCVHGEGERVALTILETEIDKWNTLESVSYLKRDGTYQQNAKSSRINDINTIPSPFLNGYFDDLIQKNPDTKWIALWETNRGCPFSCAFCDWGSSTQSRIYQFDLARLYKEVDWFSTREIDFVFCCDANFGILPRDLDLVKYIADVKVRTNFPKALSVQNTKNATERAYLVQKTLSDAGLNKGVTLSMQSVDKLTLKNIKRDNISLDSYQELQRRFTKDKVETYTDLILGLPGETYDSFTNGIQIIVENGQHNRIQFNNLSILPNAAMGDIEYQKEFGMVTIDSDIINIHGSANDTDNLILESQKLVIATNSMPLSDWRRTRAFCWMTALLYFDKVLQIPIILTTKLNNVSFKNIIEAFITPDKNQYPTLYYISKFFAEKSQDIQNGGSEYCHSKDFLDIYWPADEYILIQLIHNKKILQFYSEANALLLSLSPKDEENSPIINDGITLNQSLLKIPFVSNDITINLNYNIWEYYQGVLKSEYTDLTNSISTYCIDRKSQSWWNWDDYCREVIWYGNKKGAYLYSQEKSEKQIAGIY